MKFRQACSLALKWKPNSFFAFVAVGSTKKIKFVQFPFQVIRLKLDSFDFQKRWNHFCFFLAEKKVGWILFFSLPSTFLGVKLFGVRLWLSIAGAVTLARVCFVQLFPKLCSYFHVCPHMAQDFYYHLMTRPGFEPTSESSPSFEWLLKESSTDWSTANAATISRVNKLLKRRNFEENGVCVLSGLS